MGTRNLTIVVVNKEIKVAQYCQWDGYPSGQGLTIVKFFRDILESSPAKLALFKNKVLNNATFCASDEVSKLWEYVGVKDGWATLDQADEFKKLHPTLHRDTGAEVLNIINQSNATVPLENDIEFVKNGLSCEWAYVIDLDKNKLEVYTGVWTSREDGVLPRIAKNRFTSMGGQIRLKKKFDLLNLPSDDDFCNKLSWAR